MRQRPDTLFVLADDLSGAADCAVRAAGAGRSSVVLIDVGSRFRADVVAVDADTRERPPAQARAANAALWRAHAAHGTLLYKKIDSTLRGQFAAEMGALTGAGVAIVAPAFPGTGRTVCDGKVRLGGAPLERTEVWAAAGMTGEADVVAMLRAQGLAAEPVPLALVRGELHAWLARRVGEGGAQALVCDAETDDDLRRIAAASVGLPVYWVGSAGLATYLPDAAGIPAHGAPANPEVTGPTLCVVGSRSSRSLEQAQALEAGGGLAAFVVSPATLRAGEPDAAWRTMRNAIREALAAGRDVLVRIGREGSAGPAEGAALAGSLARMLAPGGPLVGALVATGGETARAVLCAWGVPGLRMLREVEPGVPLALALEPRPIAVVTKAGAFGTPQALQRARDAIDSLRAPPRRRPLPTHAPETPDMDRPLIAITMGDAAGVGPEIIVKSLAHHELYDTCRPLVVGDAARLRDACRRTGVDLEVRAVAAPREAAFVAGTVDCVDLGLIPPDLPYGRLSPVAGDAAFRFVAKAVELVMAQQADAICTAPLNKEALHAGGHRFPGHTELLAHLTGTPEVSMMLTAPGLRVIHVTTHLGLIDAIERIEPGLVERTIARGRETLVRAGIADPLIGVCGINPHAGEHGLFGRGEEETKIAPAVAACRAKGWRVEGPLPADTLFFRAGRGDFDLVVAMYHDQGHGPVKVLGIEAGVNVTVGLPAIRTSVDHGTAFDIAGTGRADERSMLEALRQAVALATRRDG